ncbi:segregation/condensation protein A [Caproiciproducens sp. MSJ-32]|uniref:segregation/condensation protein A n=1 Tax=Caproiciproducens sp. MSJ-32 TaxID=2841527 RepID=UPI001C0FD0F9|nr:segregation/condensation protein A [Caproiciproducens sp. MSJ-32]MBU5454559.1 segregation/condensation protein A [Caproiciproducens sp. MSJ-32]
MEMPKIKIANFEGPFDLLLHLIKKHEMDIYNIEINKITNQYIQYLDEMKTMDLEITSEFIVVAASLIEIKSRKLLPVFKEEDKAEEDLEKNLVEKLIEYKKFKNAALFLKDKYLNTGEVYTKKPELIKENKFEKKEEDLFKNLTLFDLYNIYNTLLENFLNKQNNNNSIEEIEERIYLDKFKIEDKMEDLISKVLKEKIVRFKSLVELSSCKIETVVTFLALLELIKMRRVKAYQDRIFGDILIEGRREVE